MFFLQFAVQFLCKTKQINLEMLMRKAVTFHVDSENTPTLFVHYFEAKVGMRRLLKYFNSSHAYTPLFVPCNF